MVVPWLGMPLADLLKRFKPNSRAKYVEFTTLLDPKQMPGQRYDVLEWPYVEGLRIDEAMHPLALMVVGVYGRWLPNQNGAPLRLIVPWKYGFKSIKSIVRIRFTERQPRFVLERHGAGRVWLLCEREPRGGSPALEPGQRAAHRCGPVRRPRADAAVQRLCERSGGSLSRHGPAPLLPERPSRPRDRHEQRCCIYKPVDVAACAAAAAAARGRRVSRWAAARWAPTRPSAPARPCGKTALNLLLLTLAVTPARILTGWSWLLKYRRMLGLFAFFYACAALPHLPDARSRQFDFGHLGEDIVKRPYITIGFVAVLLLLPLAATSTQSMMRRLGRRWQTLHWLIYPVAMLGVWHYYWQVKADVREPLVYVALLALLLGFRLWRRWRAATSRSGSATAPGRT